MKPTTSQRLSYPQSFMVGVLLFGLFFGAGNVIFPVKMGQLAGANALPAALGFIITAASLPVLGVIASALSRRKDLVGFAEPGGKLYAMGFTLALYLTIGPFFAIPRNAAVSFEVGIAPLLSTEDVKLPLLAYSAVFFALVLLFARKPSRIMDIVGRLLTPLFLILITVLLIMVIAKPIDSPAVHAPQGAYTKQAIHQGILEGYNTMDALASLAFAVLIISNIQQLGVREAKQTARETAQASLITIALFTLLYGGLTYLGASTRSITALDANGGGILAAVSKHYFGHFGQILLALTIATACLKTAVGLVVSIGQTFTQLFPRTRYPLWMWLFVCASFGIANFGLTTIIAYSIPVLMFLYPLAVVMILLWILGSVLPITQLTFRLTLALTGIAALLDGLRASPDWVTGTSIARTLTSLGDRYLPFFSLGLGWVTPALVGLMVGVLLMLTKLDHSPRLQEELTS